MENQRNSKGKSKKFHRMNDESSTETESESETEEEEQDDPIEEE